MIFAEKEILEDKEIAFCLAVALVLVIIGFIIDKRED